jgi:hypothetical protein
MSALDHKRTFALQEAMSALPPKADMCSAAVHVRFGPKADISRCKCHVRFAPKADFHVFIELRSCPPGLPVPEQAVAVPDVMELSEPGQVSERVFSTLPF